MLDCVVIGAGAAGIGAGLALLRANVSFVVLEAKDRVGGRAYSESHSIGHVWDHGCHWFHSSSINPLRLLALKLKHPFVDKTVPYGTKTWIDGRWDSIDPLYEEFGAVLMRAADRTRDGGDVPLAEMFVELGEIGQLLRHEFALNTSHDPEELSACDLLNFNDTDENVRVAGGYGALMARLAYALPVQLNTAVTSIEVKPQHVCVTTASGTLETKSVVLAVPQRVLEKEFIKITPGLPDAVIEAIDSLPMGWFEKTAFGFDTPLFGDLVGNGAELLLRTDDMLFPAGFGFFPGNPAFAVCHTGGHLARDLPEAERMKLCEEALVQCFGAALRKHIRSRATTRWTADPFIGGAYTGAKPGKAQMRQRFHAAVHERLFFAGEHTSLNAMATAHGAYVSGLEAARRAMALSGRRFQVDPLWLPEGL